MKKDKILALSLIVFLMFIGLASAQVLNGNFALGSANWTTGGLIGSSYGSTGSVTYLASGGYNNLSYVSVYSYSSYYSDGDWHSSSASTEVYQNTSFQAVSKPF
jgi:hypothetical protein